MLREILQFNMTVSHEFQCLQSQIADEQVVVFFRSHFRI